MRDSPNNFLWIGVYRSAANFFLNNAFSPNDSVGL